MCGEAAIVSFHGRGTKTNCIPRVILDSILCALTLHRLFEEKVGIHPV